MAMTSTTPFFRIATTIMSLCVFGGVAVTATFFLVGLTNEEAAKAMATANAATGKAAAGADIWSSFVGRYQVWIQGLLSSGFRNWGGSPTLPNVARHVAEKAPITVIVGLSTWVLAWGAGLAVAAALITWSRRGARLMQEHIYPASQAIPSLGIMLAASIALHRVVSDPSLGLRVGIAIVALTLIAAPLTTSLWLNALLRIVDREYIRVCRAKGASGCRVWVRHILPNAVVTSGLPVQSAISLAGLIIGSVFVERAFRLGGIAGDFVEAVRNGQCELAATATLIFFVTLAAAVVAAQALVALLDRRQRGAP